MLYESLRVTIDKKIILLFGMALATQATASGKGQIRDDIAVWIRMADTWLKKRMAIDLPEEKTGF